MEEREKKDSRARNGSGTHLLMFLCLELTWQQLTARKAKKC